LNHLPTALQVTAERSFLAGLGGGCAVPVAAYAWTEGGALHVHGRVSSLDGTQQVDVRDMGHATRDGAAALGQRLAQRALARGARGLLGSAP
jgi:hydroxymethylbilane synthase